MSFGLATATVASISHLEVAYVGFESIISSYVAVGRILQLGLERDYRHISYQYRMLEYSKKNIPTARW